MTNATIAINTPRLLRRFCPFEECEFSGAEGSSGRILGTCLGGGGPKGEGEGEGEGEGGEAGGDGRTVVLNGFPARLHNECVCYHMKQYAIT